MVCIDLPCLSLPKQTSRKLSNGRARTGHSVTHSVSVITNMTDIHSLVCEMSTGEEPVNLHILQLLFYTVLTVTYYTIIGLFLDSVRPLRSSRQKYCNECQACITCINFICLGFKFEYFVSD